MDKFKAIETFITVCDEGSFTKASEKLGVSVTMVSKYINFLEKEVRLKLINRNTRKQEITEAGEMYLSSCRAILRELAMTEKHLESYATVPDGRIRLCAPTNYGTYELCPLLHAFSSQHPNIRIELTLSDDISDIIEDKYDFYFRVGQLSDSGFIGMQVGEQQMRFCASPAYLEAHGTPTTLADLNDHNVLAFSPWFAGSSFKHRFDLTPLSLDASTFVSNNGNSLRICAKLGAGIILQPLPLLEDDIKRGELVVILEDIKLEPRPVFLIYQSRNLLPARMKLFIDFIKQSSSQRKGIYRC